jgi:hypothetical protein
MFQARKRRDDRRTLKRTNIAVLIRGFSMRRFIFGFACAVCAFTAAGVTTDARAASTMPTATVISKMIAAYGGKDVLDSIKTSIQVVALTVQGQSGTITTTIEVPSKFIQVVSVPVFHATVTTAFDGTNGWTSDAYGNVKTLAGDQLTLTRCEATDLTYAMLHPDPSIVLAVQPNATIDGKSLITLLMSQKNCPTVTLYVDPKTFLLSRYVSALQTIEYSDYTAGPLGEKYPKTAVSTGGIGTYYTTVTSVQDNPKLDESIFAMPVTAQPAAPTPTPTPSAKPSPSQI